MRLPTRRLLPALIASLLVAGCAQPDRNEAQRHDSPAPRGKAPLAAGTAWGPCPWEAGFLSALGQDRAQQFQQSFELGCASVPVPLDHDQPDGTQQLQIALSRTRRKGSDPAARKPLLVNFGGPGMPGVQQAAALALRAKDDLAAAFDIVGFDPRGVGGSDPVRCGPDPAKEAQEPVLDPREPDQLAKLRARISAVAQDCAARLGPKLAQLNTYQTAQDVDSVRAALGVEQIDYLGYSYGAFLGATYAHLHPKQLHAIVLDSPVDLRRDPVKTEEESLQAREAAFDSFFDWTRTQPSDADLADGRGMLAQAFLSPDSGQLISGVGVLLASPSRWPELANGLRTVLGTGDSAALRKADPGLSIANWALLCGDLPQDRRPSDAAVQRLAEEWAQKYPTFGLYELGYGNALPVGCAGWPAPPHPVAPDSINFAAGPKPLVVGGETDPVTPLPWAAPFAQAVGGALLVTAAPGHGHYARAAKGSCVDQAVDAYLQEGKLPEDGARCPV